MVLKKIRDNYDKADDAGFALKVMELGTDVENQSVVVRFVCNGIPEEHLIGLLDLSQLDAEFITTQTLEHLSDSGYSAAERISQCYDGASVMSGSGNYDVPSLKRLLEIRWTSHHDGTKCLVENQDAVMSILSEVTEDRAAAGDICTEASGLLMLRRHNFFEIGQFLLKVLGSLKSAGSMLQSPSVDLCCASEVVSASLQALRQMREEESETLTSTPASAATRQRKTSSLLTGSVVMSTVGHAEDSTLLARL
uniref:Uncharacterized protein n=1 Tax=Nothobranchius pienaari TaxID=704102 RepID=A0A1A8NGB5_9TELE